MRKWNSSLLLMLIFFVSTALAIETKIVYPADEDEGDTRVNDLKEILQLALKKTESEYGPFELRSSTLKMNRLRYLSELERGRTINIAWSSTSVEMESRFLPLRIPLRKGILGYRIALIAQENQALIDQVKSIEDLKKLTIGQGLGWLDVQLYEANGIKVEQAKYGNLFRMTTYKRFDLFPRGINEIFSEYALHSKENPTLAIEKNLLIYYPWPYYFFFNKNGYSGKTVGFFPSILPN